MNLKGPHRENVNYCYRCVEMFPEKCWS